MATTTGDQRPPLQAIRLKLDTAPLAETLAEAMTASDILGRVRLLIEAAKKIPVNPMGPLSTETFAEIIGWGDVVPADAIGYLRSLTGFTQKAWKKLYPQYRLAAFTIAKVDNVMLIDRARDLLAEALESGWTKRETLAALNDAFDRAGVTRLNPYHLDTVYQTNMQTAYMNGRIKQMSDPEVVRMLPWWRYKTRRDELVRANHAALEGFIARARDPIWGLVSPPNGFNCRCDLEPLLDGEARTELGAAAELSGRTRLPTDARPDVGFNRTPSKFLRSLASGEAFHEEVRA